MLRYELWDAKAIVHMPCLLVYLNEKVFQDLSLLHDAYRMWVHPVCYLNQV
jgi:hypothetical protein